MYKLAANTISLFIAFEAVSIFLWSAEFPIIAAAFLNSRHVSSNLTIVLTIMPSGTSVSSQMSANGVPCQFSMPALDKWALISLMNSLKTRFDYQANIQFHSALLSPKPCTPIVFTQFPIPPQVYCVLQWFIIRKHFWWCF